MQSTTVILQTLIITVILLVGVQSANVILKDSPTRLTLENGFVKLEFNKVNPQIDVIQADFVGQGNYGSNLIAAQQGTLSGIVLERQSSDGRKIQRYASSSGALSSGVSVRVIQNSSEVASVQLGNIVDNYMDPVVTSDWILSLSRSSRFFKLVVSSRAVKDSSDTISVKVSAYSRPVSVFGQFNRGIQQMMNNTLHYFASSDKLQHWYTLGFSHEMKEDPIGSLSIRPQFKQDLVMVNNVFNTTEFRSGIQFIIAGSFAGEYDHWVSEDAASIAGFVPVSAGQRFTVFNESIYANNFDFPTSVVSHGLDMNLDHIRSFYTGIYASPAGAIYSYQIPTVIAPTLLIPDRKAAYGDLYNFYDPDSWLSISALTYSGDRYLQDQSKKLLETSLEYMLPSGQIPHHFFANETTMDPIYVAISGATQTGPNCFWILAALQYVKTTGDEVWLAENIQSIERALQFLTSLYHKDFQMISAPGPLFIDVFIRNNFTSDTNSMLTHLLREVADAQVFLGKYDEAKKNVELANSIADGINKFLWNEDHYITQINPDFSTRDFVDYDSNFLAIAFNVSSLERSKKILQRASKGECLHGNPANPRPTYVSEKFYDKHNCYLNNTGDSKVTMGRIGWAEAHARAVVEDIGPIYQDILNPMIKELITKTWLYERYDCNSHSTHNPYYIEYPEMVVMLLREIVYGINLGLNSVIIRPLEAKFAYQIGDVTVKYSQTSVFIQAPGPNKHRFVRVFHLLPSTNYRIQVQEVSGNTLNTVTQSTDEKGTLAFSSTVSSRFSIYINKL